MYLQIEKFGVGFAPGPSYIRRGQDILIVSGPQGQQNDGCTIFPTIMHPTLKFWTTKLWYLVDLWATTGQWQIS